jgi:hypothetical protein
MQRRCQPGIFALESAVLLRKIERFRFGKGLRLSGNAYGFDAQKKRKSQDFQPSVALNRCKR